MRHQFSDLHAIVDKTFTIAAFFVTFFALFFHPGFLEKFRSSIYEMIGVR